MPSPGARSAAGVAGGAGRPRRGGPPRDRGRSASTNTHPRRSARPSAQLIERERPAAVIGPGSERGAEVMAHAAARTGLPLAANCTEVRPGDPWQATRQRWGGSLLEEARLDGREPPPDGGAACRGTGDRGGAEPGHGPAVRARPDRPRSSASGSPRASRPRRARSRWPTRGSSSAAAAASGARKASPSSTSSPRCSVARSASRGS